MAKKKNLTKRVETPPKPSSSSEDETEDVEEQRSDSSSEEDEDELMQPVQITTVLPSNPRSAKSKKKEEVRGEPSSPLRRTTRPRGEGTSSTPVTAKRAKAEEKKDTPIHKLWNEEDEIVVLQGIIDFKADKRKTPYEDKEGFHDFVKRSLTCKVSSNQLSDKIRSLKRKYMDNGRTFTKAHDQECFALSKSIWGSHGLDLESSAVKTKKKKVDSSKQVEKDKEVFVLGGDSEPFGVRSSDSDWFEQSRLVGSIAKFGVDEHSVKEKWRTVPVETKKKLEEKWRLLQDKEFQFVLQKTAFLNEMTSAMAEATPNH